MIGGLLFDFAKEGERCGVAVDKGPSSDRTDFTGGEEAGDGDFSEDIARDGDVVIGLGE